MEIVIYKTVLFFFILPPQKPLWLHLPMNCFAYSICFVFMVRAAMLLSLKVYFCKIVDQPLYRFVQTSFAFCFYFDRVQSTYRGVILFCQLLQFNKANSLSFLEQVNQGTTLLWTFTTIFVLPLCNPIKLIW